MNDDNLVRNAVFEIKVYEDKGEGRHSLSRTGTGFLIHDEYHFITAQHVVELSSKGNAIIKAIINGKDYRARIKQIFAHGIDIALLILDAPVTGVKPLKLAQSTERGQAFRAFGFPVEFDQNWFSGRISGQLSDNRYQLRLDEPFEKQLTGLSGAPVLNDDNEVIGVFLRHRPADHFAEMTASAAFSLLLNFVSDDNSTLTCLVITSENERVLNASGSIATLMNAVDAAVERLKVSNVLSKPVNIEQHYASDIFESEEPYRQAIIALCRADIAVFDLTNYEPGIMFLLGVRSAVRRGVTICSLGGDFAIGDATEFPFNIREVNIASHSELQFRKDYESKPPSLLYARMIEGLRNATSFYYNDLPVFTGIRNLPKDRTRMISVDQQMLLLCSYSKTYQEINWHHVRDSFRNYYEPQYPHSKLIRVLDLQSPNMISTTMYEYIRRTNLCIVDLSDWRPNVFFEFGVRCAIERNRNGTFCLIDSAQAEGLKAIAENPDEADTIVETLKLFSRENSGERADVIARMKLIARQCVAILNLFQHMPYVCKLYQINPYPYTEILETHRNNVSATRHRGLNPTDTHEIISVHYIPDGEIFVKSIHHDLMDEADLFKPEDTPKVLFPANKRLVELASHAVTERYYAAWAYLDHRYSVEHLKSDESLARDYVDIGYRLLLQLSLQESEKKEISRIIEKLSKFDDQISHMVDVELANVEHKVTDESVGSLLQSVDILYYSGRVNRDEKHYDLALSKSDRAIFILDTLRVLDNLRDSDTKKINKMLAECYGQKGSIYNRTGAFANAEQQYREGLKYESKDSTYNLSNAIVNSILAGTSEMSQLAGQIKQVVENLQRQVEGERSNDFWAWFDYGQFNLLLGQMDAAEHSYNEVNDLGPDKLKKGTHKRILMALKDALQSKAPEIASLIGEILDRFLLDAEYDTES